MRWRVESWDPAYGASTDGDTTELGRSSARVTLDMELPAEKWRPIDPAPSARGWRNVLFVDGVRRVDALAWVLEPNRAGEPDGSGASGTGTAPALCASYAAGAVCASPDGARLVTARVRRGLFSTSEWATEVVTPAGRYDLVRIPPRGEPMSDLNLGLQRELASLEALVAGSARDALPESDDDLLVVDGPLRGRAHLPRALGFIKTHRGEYLPAAQHRLVGALTPGQRTPVFGLGTNWQRRSWYLKLPGRPGAPWAGVVRMECSAELPLDEVIALANGSAPLLCRYASSEYKDARAPQNLYPIGGLERELRRRLGDQGLLYRAIRRVANLASAD